MGWFYYFSPKHNILLGFFPNIQTVIVLLNWVLFPKKEILINSSTLIQPLSNLKKGDGGTFGLSFF